MNLLSHLPALITRQQAAQILEVSDTGVSFLARRGDLPEVRFSKRRVLYQLQEVVQLAKRRGVNTLPTKEYNE